MTQQQANSFCSITLYTTYLRVLAIWKILVKDFHRQSWYLYCMPTLAQGVINQIKKNVFIILHVIEVIQACKSLGPHHSGSKEWKKLSLHYIRTLKYWINWLHVELYGSWNKGTYFKISYIHECKISNSYFGPAQGMGTINIKYMKMLAYWIDKLY